MTKLAAILLVVYLGITFGLRSLVQKRRTGSTGWRGISGRLGSAEWWGGVLLAVATFAAIASPIADLAGWMPLIPLLASDAIRMLGLVTVLAGTSATFWAQMAMGDSWRIGVEQSEVTSLITSGPFAVARNPIFSAMLLSLAGLALLVPNALAIGAWALATTGIELQVRVVEEPYLLRVHGGAYRDYARRVGRFVPLLGRM